VVLPLPPADSHFEPKRPDIHGRQDDGRGATAYRAAPATQVRSDAARSCKLAEARVAQLRAEPNREEVMRFARELECEELRPQALRLLESLGVSLSAGEDFPRSVTPKEGRRYGPGPTPTQSREGALSRRPPRRRQWDRPTSSSPMLRTRRLAGFRRTAPALSVIGCRRPYLRRILNLALGGLKLKANARRAYNEGRRSAVWSKRRRAPAGNAS
jgi:hypothetical protein